MAVSLANRMALASPHVQALTVEANEFPALSSQFGVRSVPQTVVNRRGAFLGALPERQFVQAVLRVAGVELEAPAREERGASTDLTD